MRLSRLVSAVHRRRSILIIGNVSQTPYCNNLLPVVAAWQAVTDVRVLEPLHVAGFVPTGGARPAPVPAAAFPGILDNFNPDVIVCLAGGIYLPPESREKLPEAAVTVGLALSDPLGLEASLAIAPFFDLFYSQDPHALPFYRDRGLSVGLCAPAVDTHLYQPVTSEPNCDVIFVGKWTEHRDRLIQALAAVCRVRVHSNANEERWSVKAFSPLEDPPALARAFSRARIGLEVALVEQPGNPLDGSIRLTNRPQFAAATGTPSLVEAYDELHRFFKAGGEIAAYRSPDELKEKAVFLLENPNLRERMGRRARRRVVRDHTWGKRVRMLLDDVDDFVRKR